MRHGNWKVLARLDGGKLPKMTNVTSKNRELVREAKITDVEIYDLAKDIAESRNVAEDDPARTAALKQTLEKQYRELVDGSHVW